MMHLVPANIRTKVGTVRGWAIQNDAGQYYIWAYFDKNKARHDASRLDPSEDIGTWKPTTALCVMSDMELKKWQQHVRQLQFKQQFEEKGNG